jgi:predicted nuclease of predicted toxin-antitoxin system
LRLLANETVPRRLVEALRSAGHDLVWIAEDEPSTSDSDVLERAIRESRVLLTFDKDFGELAFKRRLPSHCGVILVRLPPVPDEVTRLVLEAMGSGVAFVGRFVVIESGRIRERLLPPAAPGS